MAERRIAESERRGRWEDLAEELEDSSGAIIVEGGNERGFAVVSLDRYRVLVEQEQQARLARAREAWSDLERRQAGRNQDLTEEQVEELADRFANEFATELFAEGKIRYPDE